MGSPQKSRCIFLSHTADLRVIPRRRSYVAAAEKAVSTAGHVVKDMAYLPAAARAPADVCREAVLDSNLLVLIAGFRYGSLLRGGPAVSHTEWEFQVAMTARIPTLVFLLNDDAEGFDAPVLESVDTDRQIRFRERLRESGLTLAMVDSPGSLEAALLHALYEELSDAAVDGSGHRTNNVEVRDSTAVQIGDGTTMTNNFPKPKRWRRFWHK